MPVYSVLRYLHIPRYISNRDRCLTILAKNTFEDAIVNKNSTINAMNTIHKNSTAMSLFNSFIPFSCRMDIIPIFKWKSDQFLVMHTNIFQILLAWQLRCQNGISDMLKQTFGIVYTVFSHCILQNYLLFLRVILTFNKLLI